MNRLRHLRKAKGYSQKELADKMGLTLAAISKWETGYNEPSVDDIGRLCRILECTADYLLGYADVNDYKIELYGNQIPKSLRELGLERVELLREYVDEHGGLHPDVQRELLRLMAEAKLLQDKDGHSS
jgi:transcriptional regulator with XRE-family HTH domain